MKKKVVTLPLSEIKETFYVRIGLDDDRVLHFTELYQNGVKLPPLLVTEDSRELVDGRHRKRALEMINEAEAECTLVDSASRPKLILMALEANVGGSKPPTRADINHTIQLLLEAGVSRKNIVWQIARVTPFPERLVRRHIDDVQSALAKARLNHAVNAVVNGTLNTPQAAEQFKVRVETLRTQLRGITKDKAVIGLHEVKAGLTSKFRSLSVSNAALSRKLIEDYRDGEATEKNVRVTLGHISGLINQMSKSHQDWMKRFEALVSGGNSQPEAAQGVKKPSNGSARAALHKMGLAQQEGESNE